MYIVGVMTMAILCEKYLDMSSLVNPGRVVWCPEWTACKNFGYQYLWDPD